MIGACNGFQVMVQVGLLPGPEAGHASDWPADRAPEQTVALAHNNGGRFIDRWVRVAANPASPCLWTRPLAEWAAENPEQAEDALMLPIAHGEGRFVTAGPRVLTGLREHGQIALTYVDNPNGSAADIAGICDPTGRIFGLMPHPERYLEWTLHPFWTRLDPAMRTSDKPTPGSMMFRAAVEAAQTARV
jgi:phosphoribosylformylglycinamidine (FGAM) synthase-like amidotransferase family enzyme